MEDEINDGSRKLYESMEKIICDYGDFLNKIDDFEKKWDIHDISNDNPVSSVREVESQLRILKPQILRKTKKCVVFGKTSVGKSTFINALLTENILPSGFGTTTKCFCEIKASPKNYNYLVVDGSDQERRLDEIREISGQIATENLARRPYIRLFYDRQRCELLKGDVVIVDTPATDTHTDLDNDVEFLCKEADVIILLVNSTGTLQLSDVDFITRHRMIFSMLTVLIVYTWWDVVQPEDDDESTKQSALAQPENDGSIKQQHIENAKTFLCRELNYSEQTARDNIYFISGKERLQMVSQASKDHSTGNNDLQTQRNTDFDIFFQFLEGKLSENAVRKDNYFHAVYSRLSSTILNHASSINRMVQKRKILVQKIKKILPNTDEINREINTEVPKVFESALEEFIVESNEKKEESDQRLYDLFEAIIDRSLEGLKCKIIDLLWDDDDRIYSIRKQNIQEVYFPNYLDLTDEKKSMDMSSMNMNLSSIRKKSKEFTTAMDPISSIIAGLVAREAELAVAGTVGVGVALGAIGGAGGVGAVAVTGGTSVGIMTGLKKEIDYLWKANINNMKLKWKELENPLLNSYSTFINKMEKDILEFFSSVDTEFQNIKKNLDTVKEELKNFLDPSPMFKT